MSIYNMFFAVLGVISLGSYNSMMLKQDSRLWMTGLVTRDYDAGDVTLLRWSVFRLTSLSGVKGMDSKTNHSIVLKQDGSVYAQGSNRNGQLGDGSNNFRRTYVQIFTGGVLDVSTGSFHSVILNQDGSVWATGLNDAGQLGDGSNIGRRSFV